MIALHIQAYLTTRAGVQYDINFPCYRAVARIRRPYPFSNITATEDDYKKIEILIDSSLCHCKLASLSVREKEGEGEKPAETSLYLLPGESSRPQSHPNPNQ